MQRKALPSSGNSSIVQSNSDFNAAAIRASLRVFFASQTGLKLWDLVNEHILARGKSRKYAGLPEISLQLAHYLDQSQTLPSSSPPTSASPSPSRRSYSFIVSCSASSHACAPISSRKMQHPSVDAILASRDLSPPALPPPLAPVLGVSRSASIPQSNSAFQSRYT